jgi:branched-chain amino acid transport system ATP-binding protein
LENAVFAQRIVVGRDNHIGPEPSAAAANSAPVMLELRDVTVRYGPVVGVRDLSLKLYSGEIVTLLGSNGAGKSTTLNAVIGLTPPSDGRVVFEEEDITSRAPEAIVKRGVTLVPEGRHIFANLTVGENLRLGAAALSREEYEELLPEVLDLFPVVKERLGTRAGLFSGGEQQQLAIARALMSRPRLMLLDEPSLGLAPRIVATVFELIETLRRRGVTILLVEQSVERALDVADRAYVLSSGQLQMSENADSIDSAAVENAYLGLSSGEV